MYDSEASSTTSSRRDGSEMKLPPQPKEESPSSSSADQQSKSTSRHPGNKTDSPGKRKRKRFSSETEDGRLIEAVTRNTDELTGKINWSAVYSAFPDRPKGTLKSRWANRLDPNLDHSPFTNEDDELLWKAHLELGHKWLEISIQYFHGKRAILTLRNRFFRNSAFRNYIANQYGPDAYQNQKMNADTLALAEKELKTKSKKKDEPSSPMSPKKKSGSPSKDGRRSPQTSCPVSTHSDFPPKGESIVDAAEAASSSNSIRESKEGSRHGYQQDASNIFTPDDDNLLWLAHVEHKKDWNKIKEEVFRDRRPINQIIGRWYHSEFIQFVHQKYGPNAYIQEARKTLGC